MWSYFGFDGLGFAPRNGGLKPVDIRCSHTKVDDALKRQM